MTRHRGSPRPWEQPRLSAGLATRSGSVWGASDLPDDIPGSVEEALTLLAIDYRTTWRDELEALCPFHDERKESFGINASSGLWLCRASCDASGGSGNLPQLVERLCDVTPRRARRWLRKIDFSTEVVAQEPDAPVEWDEEFLDDFTTPPTWALRDRGISSRAARRLGIKWDLDDGAWVSPIRDPDTGALWGWQTKTSGVPRTTAGTPKSRTLFGLDAASPGETLILVEDALDAAVLLTAGYPGGVASFGASVSRRQVELLGDRAGKLVLALDNDPAGREGQLMLLDRLSGLRLTGLTIAAFNYSNAPGKKDPGEMEDEEIRWAIRHVVPVGQ